MKRRVNQRDPALWVQTGQTYHGRWWAKLHSTSGRLLYVVAQTEADALAGLGHKVAALMGALPNVEAQITAITAWRREEGR